MNISFVETEKSTIFKINNFPEEYHKVFQGCFYTLEGDSYIKEFSNSLDNIEKIKRNYLKYAEEMFAQVGYFKPIPWEEALMNFIEKVEGSGIDWWLTGSCAACLRGVPLRPHDLDIMLDSRQLHRVNEVFVDNIIEPIVDSRGWVTEYFGVAFLGARVDLAFNPQECLDNPEPADCGPYAMRNLEEFHWRGHKVKIPPIHLQLSINRRRGRMDRVKLIEEFIDKYS